MPSNTSINEFEERVLFRGGEGGYHTYRIPGMAVTTKGTILAFCEGRRDSAADAGSIDILVRRSTDNAKSWARARSIISGAGATVGNPCPVVDRQTGTIWLFFNWNPAEDNEDKILAGEGARGIFVTSSADDGVTWAPPTDLTSVLKPGNWTWYANGPGHGIQLSSGRLVVPCNHAELRAGREPGPYCCHIVFSDDHGETWQLGVNVGENTNECQVVELEDGSLYINMRSYHGQSRRAVSVSKDGGLSWGPVTLDSELVEPVCHGSTVRYTLNRVHGRGRLLFANPASTRRENMTIRISYDEGNTWPAAKCLYGGAAAYSELAVAPDMSILCLYERGVESAYEEIALAHFTLNWLSDGDDGLD